MDIIIVVLAVAGVSLLWRTYRYDPENPFNDKLDRLPYVLRKPVTCGLCFTFWISCVCTVILVPLANVAFALPYRFPVAAIFRSIIGFGIEWFALGTLATAVVYAVDVLFQVSHYYKHKAAHEHEE
jgi:hypothetical protein